MLDTAMLKVVSKTWPRINRDAGPHESVGDA